MANFKELKSIVDAAERDAENFFKHDNKAAGTRLRKKLQSIKVLAQELRQEVSRRKLESK